MNMLMIVVACFSLCWFPLETYLLLNEVRPEINGYVHFSVEFLVYWQSDFRWKYINVLFFCAHWLAMSNSCLNPIIYGLFNNKYKREYRRVFNCLRCRAEAELTDETLKFDTEYSVGGVVQRTWPSPCSQDGTPFYTETFQIGAPPSTEIGANCQTKRSSHS